MLSKACSSVFWYWVHGCYSFGKDLVLLNPQSRRSLAERKTPKELGKELGIVDGDTSDSDRDSTSIFDSNTHIQQKFCFDRICQVLQESCGEYLHQVLCVNYECLGNLLDFKYDKTLGVQPNDYVVLKFLDMEYLEDFSIWNLDDELGDGFVEEWKNEMLNQPKVQT
ncbi:unnamed protein product [Ambrosiozyma monospora]|uniref:Unnamed protein product n=1 Tax=Ambrosiozyma monospora TaxID=43982 RepID=A0ACB5U0M5_AMBMO|nr:unnamed protein product [Ambrosiozyma monospora]